MVWPKLSTRRKPPSRSSDETTFAFNFTDWAITHSIFSRLRRSYFTSAFSKNSNSSGLPITPHFNDHVTRREIRVPATCREPKDRSAPRGAGEMSPADFFHPADLHRFCHLSSHPPGP